jgi:hypothetical protein
MLSAPSSKLHSLVDDVGVHSAVVLVYWCATKIDCYCDHTMKCRVCRVAVLSCVKQEKHSLRGLGNE